VAIKALPTGRGRLYRIVKWRRGAFKRPVFDKARSRAEGKKIRFWRDGWRVFVAIVYYRVAE
jgi:hypothetical protein